MDLELLSPAGNLVAITTRGRVSTPGVNQVPWSGALATGIYLLRATATTDEGTSTQAVRPVVIVR